MKTAIRLFAIIVVLHVVPVAVQASDLDKPYSPTRKEWLELSIFKLIKDRTDAWERRISFIVWVREKENTVFITLTSANGQSSFEQSSLSKKAEQIYVDTIKMDVENFLKTYEWSKNLKVFVQFM